MTCSKALRILLSAAVTATSLSPAYGQLRVAPVAPRLTGVAAPAVVTPVLTAPGLSAPALASPSASLPSALPAAAVLAIAAAPSARASAVAIAAPAALGGAPAAFAAASARSAAVSEAVGRLFSAPAQPGSAQMGARLDSLFDARLEAKGSLNGVSAKNSDDDSMEAPEATAAEAGDFAPEGADDTLDLWVGRTVRTKLYNSQVSASIRLINNKGSAWFWGKYQKELPVRVVSGGRMLFVTRITDAATKKVKDLDLGDLKAYFGSRLARSEAGVSEKDLVAKLQQRLLAELRFKAGRNANAPKVIGLDSEVRVLHYLPYRQAQHLPENNAEPAPSVRPRRPVTVPQALEPLSRMLPRVVLVDLRQMGDSLSFDVLEDMGKLQKSGVTFVLMTDKTQDEVDRMIERGVTLSQRDDVVRWKLLTLSNDGNTLYGYSGAFPKLLASRSFDPYQQELLRTAAAASIGGRTVEDRAYGLTLTPKKGVAAEALKAELERNIARFGLPAGAYAVTLAEHDGKPAVRVRPGTLADSMAWLRGQLEEGQGLYANPEQLLTASADPAVQAGLPGSIHASAHMAEAPAADHAETALAAMLGAYRENRAGDLVASASSLKAFKQKRFYESGGGNDMRIYMLLGHVAHTAFDWAMQTYNRTGQLPPFAELQAKAHAIWDKESIEATVHLMEKPRERALGYRDAMDARMQTMYIELQEALKLYPLSLGTELPNLMVVERYNKAGEPTHRDIFRGLYDLVLARRTDKGLDVMIGDFKTGQTPALQHMLKDIQVLLYDFFSRTMWKALSAPYSVLGAFEPVVRTSLGFLYPRGMQSVSIGEFDRLPFESLLANLMNGLRKRKGVKTPETLAKEAAKAEKAARAEARAKAKAEKQAPGAKPSKKK